jgi:hypothetical protein
MWISENCFLAGKATDVSPQGTFLCLVWLPSGVLKVGGKYRLDVFRSAGETFTCVGVVRHVSTRGVGLEVVEGLPVDAFTPQSTAAGASD